MNANSGWSLPELTGRTAVVTGANSGLGLEITTRLAGAGAHVVLACRNPERATAAVEKVRSRAPGAAVVTEALDLADLSSVRDFANRFTATHDRLDLLVNNAGLMGIDQSRTADGFETTFGVNHLGHFALVQHLLPLVLSTNGSRIGTMASLMHRVGRMQFDDLMFERRYARWTAYSQSKLSNMLFNLGLRKRLVDIGSDTLAVAAHPGVSRTHLGHDGTSIANRLWPTLQAVSTQPVRIGALPMLRALTDPHAVNGDFFGPRFVYAGAPIRERPAKRGLDTDAAERLWSDSVELTGLDAFAGIIRA